MFAAAGLSGARLSGAMLGNSYEKRSRGEVSQRSRGKGEVKQGLATA